MQMTLISPDGREEWIATGEEECRELALAGWAPREHFEGERLPRDSGVPGQLLARLSSTTEARRVPSGASAPNLAHLDDDELLQELKRRRAAKAEAEQAQAEAEAEAEREQAAAAKKQADDKAKAEAANAARAKADEKSTESKSTSSK